MFPLFSSSICREVIEPDDMILVFWMLTLKSAFFTLLFQLHQELFSFSSLSAIRVVSSAYLRLLFLLAILIPACDSSSLAFPMMCSAYKLNKQGDNTQPCHNTFPILNPSVILCPVLTVTSWPTYRFLRRQLNGLVVTSLEEFSTICCDPHKAKKFSVVNEAEVDVFLELPCFFYDPMNVDQFDLWFLCLFETQCVHLEVLSTCTNEA